MLTFIAYVLIGVLWWNHRQLRREFERAMVPAPAPEAPPVMQVHTEVHTRPMPVPPPLPLPTPPSAPPSQPMAETPLPVPSRNWEELIGGNVLNKLGALVLVIGIALFLSYSFARMGPAGRALTSLAVSGAILGGGLLLERKETYRVFSRGLIAAGWAGLYFTSYAMYAIEAVRVIPNALLGTVLMVGVGIAMVTHSLRYRVQSLSALAYGCVFAALALGENSAFAVAALLPLAASMLYLARRFDWNWLALFGAAGTYVTFLTRPASGATLLAIQSMLLAFWLLFEIFDLLRIHSATKRDPLLFGVNALAGLGASAALWYRMAPDAMWQFCVAGSILYLASTWVRFAIGESSTLEASVTLWEASVTLSVALAALGIFAGVEGLWTSLAYIALAEVVFLASLRVRHVLRARHGARYVWLRALSLAAFGVAAMEIASRAYLDVWAVPVAVLGAVFYLNLFLDRTARYFGFLGSACVVLLLTFQLPEQWAGLGVIAFSALLFEAGYRGGLADFRWQSYGASVAGVAAVVLYIVDRHAGYWLGGVAAAAFVAHSIRAGRWLPSLLDRERTIMQGGAAVLSTILILAGMLGFPGDYEPVGLAAIALVLMLGGLWLGSGPFLWQSRVLSLLAGALALTQGSEGVLNATCVALWFLLAMMLERRANARAGAPYAIAAAILGGVAIERGVSGPMLTIGWSLEGIALLGLGFPARERALRLAGLALLLGCIGKVFVYDLRNLETMYRILSFIGLGAVLIGVSFIYTRFRDQLRRYL